MIEVYHNLHTGTWSVRRHGIVERHPKKIMMSDVTFKVRDGGREKVRSSHRKNVHAFLKGVYRGHMKDYERQAVGEWRRVTYNPYQNDTFVDVETGEPVLHADFVRASTEYGVWYANGLWWHGRHDETQPAQ